MSRFYCCVSSFAIISSAFVSSAAMAQSGVYSGTVDVFKDIASNCHISVIFDPIGMKADVSIASPESFCAYWSINSNPHEYSVSGTTITIQDVNMDPNRCFDDLIATYDSVNDTVSVDDELTDRDGGRNCFITSNGPLMH